MFLAVSFPVKWQIYIQCDIHGLGFEKCDVSVVMMVCVDLKVIGWRRAASFDDCKIGWSKFRVAFGVRRCD